MNVSKILSRVHAVIIWVRYPGSHTNVDYGISCKRGLIAGGPSHSQFYLQFLANF
jgi:hypothetical protein